MSAMGASSQREARLNEPNARALQSEARANVVKGTARQREGPDE